MTYTPIWAKISKNSYRARTICLLLPILFFIIFPPIFIFFQDRTIYQQADAIPVTEVGIVFGAGSTAKHKPTGMLQDRLDTALALYNRGTIAKILVSGDNSDSHNNESDVMRDFLVSEGVPEDAVTVDSEGNRTYDTCYRAKYAFNVNHALLISHGYHLPRAIFLCGHFGIQSEGVSASPDTYPGELYYKIREVAALYRSVLDVLLLKPVPTL